MILKKCDVIRDQEWHLAFYQSIIWGHFLVIYHMALNDKNGSNRLLKLLFLTPEISNCVYCAKWKSEIKINSY